MGGSLDQLGFLFAGPVRLAAKKHTRDSMSESSSYPVLLRWIYMRGSLVQLGLLLAGPVRLSAKTHTTGSLSDNELMTGTIVIRDKGLP